LTGKSTETGASGSEKVEERGDYTEHEARAKAFAEGPQEFSLKQRAIKPSGTAQQLVNLPILFSEWDS